MMRSAQPVAVTKEDLRKCNKKKYLKWRPRGERSHANAIICPPGRDRGEEKFPHQIHILCTQYPVCILWVRKLLFRSAIQGVWQHVIRHAEFPNNALFATLSSVCSSRHARKKREAVSNISQPVLFLQVLRWC
ncbi:hypothetical protein CEXT_782611 [Caerostris extrusa]|uniref:Uncharacterized protein n=1 Tax=Caerostris extrusa TaxID=172846 RepID=A0AAV4XJC8_CAEEX|nr:hypothetical protein CEXT_782611 [Caerostris extrusa]